MLCGFKITSLKFDYNFEAFFPNEDKELEFYENYRHQFEYDNEFVLIALENKEGIFKKDFLEKVNQLSKDLSKLNHVKQVISPTNLKKLSLGGLAPVQLKVLHLDNPDLYKDDSTAIYSSGEFVGSFFPKNAKSLSIYIKTHDNLSKVKSDSLADNIVECLNKYSFEETHYVGRIFAQDVYLQNLQKEFVYFLSISFALVILFLWFSFRTIHGVIIPLIIVLISIFWTLGLMALMGKSIDIMTAMLPTMIFIAGMSDVVHFYSKYTHELHNKTDRSILVKLIIKEVGLATLLTSFTTVLGFMSLLFSSMRPIREFGIYTSAGVVFAFILTYTLLPALLFFLKPKPPKKYSSNNKGWDNLIRRGIKTVFRKQTAIIVTTCVLVVLGIYGMTKIKINNLLLDDLTDGVKIKQDFNFFDKEYSGVRPLEIQISVVNDSKNIWDSTIIKQVSALDDFIKNEYQAGFLYSPASLVKSLNSSLTDGNSNNLPVGSDYQSIVDELVKNKKNKDIKRLISQDLKSARITAKMPDVGSSIVKKHNEKLDEFITSSINPNDIKITVTGAAHLVDLNNTYMVYSMLQGFLFSVIIIGLITFLLHRSWRMLLVFFIPNLVPLIVMAGIMGLTGIELKSATSLVFSIALGIATDDTIHFISRLKIEMDYGKSVLYAFKRTFFETGKPIVLTSFILLGGFVSLMTSTFQSTYYFGLLICITILFALIADLFLLPVLLLSIFGKKRLKVSSNEQNPVQNP